MLSKDRVREAVERLNIVGFEDSPMKEDLNILLALAQKYLDGEIVPKSFEPKVEELTQFLWDYFKGTELGELMNGKVDCMHLATAIVEYLRGKKV